MNAVQRSASWLRCRLHFVLMPFSGLVIAIPVFSMGQTCAVPVLWFCCSCCICSQISLFSLQFAAFFFFKWCKEWLLLVEKIFQCQTQRPKPNSRVPKPKPTCAQT